MGADEQQLLERKVPQLRVYCGDEPHRNGRRHMSDSMRHAQRAWARMEVYQASLYGGGRLPTLIFG